MIFPNAVRILARSVGKTLSAIDFVPASNQELSFVVSKEITISKMIATAMQLITGMSRKIRPLKTRKRFTVATTTLSQKMTHNKVNTANLFYIS